MKVRPRLTKSFQQSSTSATGKRKCFWQGTQVCACDICKRERGES